MSVVISHELFTVPQHVKPHMFLVQSVTVTVAKAAARTVEQLQERGLGFRAWLYAELYREMLVFAVVGLLDVRISCHWAL